MILRVEAGLGSVTEWWHFHRNWLADYFPHHTVILDWQGTQGHWGPSHSLSLSLSLPVSIDKLHALGSEGEDEGVPWAAEGQDLYETGGQGESTLMPTEGTESQSPILHGRSASLSPEHHWHGEERNTPSRDETDGAVASDQTSLVYGKHSAHTHLTI